MPVTVFRAKSPTIEAPTHWCAVRSASLKSPLYSFCPR